LDFLRTRHHHDAIAKFFTTGFIKKRDISKKVLIRLAMLFRFATPMATNWRMKNLLELAPFLGCHKYNGAKCAPIQLSIFIKNCIPKSRTDFGKHVLILTGKLARHHIGIKERGFWQQLAQAIYKG